jgi:hypothetical protein
MKFNTQEHGRILMYWRPIARMTCENNKIKQSDLDMLLFLFGQGLFKRSDFKDFEAAFGFDKKRFNRLLRDGWFYKWRDNKGPYAAIYDMTQKGKQTIIHVYRKLFGEEDISEHYRMLPTYKSRANHMRAVKKGLIKRINEENRQRRQTPE